MSNGTKRNSVDFREWLDHVFSLAEDSIYIGLGMLLIAIAFTLLIAEIVYSARYVSTLALSENIVFLLDRILLYLRSIL
jgi:hypothetical protein